jgi:Protein of unknown function (DUF2924)
MTATSPVLKQIAGLPKLSQDELKALWREYFGVEPPAYRRGFLVRGLAHRIQELTYGAAEQARILRLLIERIDVAPDGISLTLHAAGIRSLVAELAGQGAPALAVSEPVLEAAE